MCIRCQCLKYYEQIENLYRVQHYSITKEKKWFSAEEKSGIIRAKAMVVPFYSEKENIVWKQITDSYNRAKKTRINTRWQDRSIYPERRLSGQIFINITGIKWKCK